jgi:hypothetical protein
MKQGGMIGMSENILQTIQTLVQDVIAPDVRELKVRVASLEKELDLRFDTVDLKLAEADKRSDLQFQAIYARLALHEANADLRFQTLVSEIRESRAQEELARVKFNSKIVGRIALLEEKRQ